MLPHPDTLQFIIETRHQERLRDAANDRLAADAQARRPAPLTRIREAAMVLLAWRSRPLARRHQATSSGVIRSVA